MTRNGFQLLIPLLVVMLSISVMNAILLQTTGRIVPELISEAVRPLVLASDTLMAVLISLFICNLLWFIGIHGALIITGIMNPFWMTYLFENQQALAAGSPTLPHIYLQGFWDFYLLIGGIGSTLPLVLMAMRSRSRQLKSVAKIGLLPSLFNINEPILFGFPVIMNPVFLLPFLFVPLINACIAWYLTQLGILDRAVAMLPWSMPSPLGAAWSANGSWKNLCMSLFAMFNALDALSPLLQSVRTSARGNRTLILSPSAAYPRRHLLISSSFRSTASARRHSCHFM